MKTASMSSTPSIAIEVDKSHSYNKTLILFLTERVSILSFADNYLFWNILVLLHIR